MTESSPISPKKRERTGSIDDPPCEKNPEVLCDFCEERKLEALKSCLVCQSSYCETHLEPHLRVAGLKKHKLINPVTNLEDYICQKHVRPLELFCRDDQTIVCLSCTDGDHKNHNTVPIEEEIDKKTKLIIKLQEVQQMIQERNKKIHDVKHSSEVRKKNKEKEKAAHAELFTDLIRSIEKGETDLLERTEEQQKAAEKQEKEFVEFLGQEITELKIKNTELKQKITELQTRNTEQEQVSQTEDQHLLLQIYSSLRSSGNTRNWSEISVKTVESLETPWTVLTQLKDTLDEKLTPTDSTDLKRMQQYEVDVTLDPDTAHLALILSDDGKRVRDGDIEQKLPDKPERFNPCPCVLGKEGFSSGRFYFEVQVRGKTEWDLGVARESISRKGKITVRPSDGFWTVILRNGNEYKAAAGPPVSLCLRVKPQWVGVFVDYEEGLVSFYDVESSSHIYSFTGQSFTGKLYPYFSPGPNDGCNNSTPLIITPVT
ncbi:E3 ubiquitin-protein ligase TRIM39-like isoform X2 [Megalobrama amblycephala]|uniref:E3 ubiquitin-protein ligase TRIM39-like isoform X2 n=1 Tax=Megalobrama amblycephala TaxID=75352 RepID=UPI002014007E|nr:E3 ubiquitin-protein ligase TRIM39-like isoform X2 [Megalobrama amblycephala]